MPLKNLLFIPLLTLCAAGSKMHHAKNDGRLATTMGNHHVLLKYAGSLTGRYNIAVGAQVAMDSSIGFRYDVTFQNGGALMSHVAFFYKFSSPHQTIYYNYLNHKSEIITGNQSAKDIGLAVVGLEKIDSFSCTHLRQQNDHEQQDYWMSTSVPGFAQLAGKLKYIDPSLAVMVINQTIFNWGGLVRVKTTGVVPKTGETTTLTLKLVQATTGLPFSTDEFDVPSN